MLPETHVLGWPHPALVLTPITCSVSAQMEIGVEASLGLDLGKAANNSLCLGCEAINSPGGPRELEIQSAVNQLETGSFPGIPTPSRTVSWSRSPVPALTGTHCSDRDRRRDQPSETTRPECRRRWPWPSCRMLQRGRRLPAPESFPVTQHLTPFHKGATFSPVPFPGFL